MPRRTASGRVRGGEPRALLVVVGELERAREDRVHVDLVAHHLPDRARLPGLDEVAAAQLVGREADRRRDAVHVPLEREDALRRAEAAEGAVRRNVGRHRAAADADVRDRSTGPDAWIVPRDSTTGDSVQ